MAKKKIIALFVMAALLVTAALPVLVACNDKADVTGKGVERPENIFTDDIDTVDSENLAASASVTTASDSIHATGIIARICQAIQTSVQPLVDFFCAIRLISMQSLDCLQEVVNSRIAQTFIRYAQKSQDAQSVLEIMWTLSLLSTSCACSLKD